MKLNSVASAIGIAVLALGVSMAHAADDKKKGSNQGKAGTQTESSTAMQGVAAAQALVRYGDATKDPLALITAAKILRDVGGSDSKAQRTGGKAGDDKNKPDATAVPAILERAKGMAAGRADLLAMVEDLSKAATRGAVGGPGILRTVVRSRETDSFRVTFRGGERAVVTVSGDGDSDLDLFVYDENGNLICKDDDRTDDMVCGFSPKWTGPFTIRVRNLGIANQYVIRHN